MVRRILKASESRGAVELADVELRHDVVNIENDFGAAEFGEERGEDFEIGNGMDVDEVVFFFEMAARQESHRAQEEHHQPRDVGELALFVDLAGLDAIDADAVEDFESRQALTPERNRFDGITAFGQGFGVSPDAIVGFVEGIRHHADFHRFPELLRVNRPPRGRVEVSPCFRIIVCGHFPGSLELGRLVQTIPIEIGDREKAM